MPKFFFYFSSLISISSNFLRRISHVPSANMSPTIPVHNDLFTLLHSHSTRLWFVWFSQDTDITATKSHSSSPNRAASSSSLSRRNGDSSPLVTSPAMSCSSTRSSCSPTPMKSGTDEVSTDISNNQVNLNPFFNSPEIRAFLLGTSDTLPWDLSNMTSSVGFHDSIMSCSGSSDNNYCAEHTHSANQLAPLPYSTQLSTDIDPVNGTSIDSPVAMSPDDSHQAPLASCEEDDDLCLNVVSCDDWYCMHAASRFEMGMHTSEPPPTARMHRLFRLDQSSLPISLSVIRYHRTCMAFYLQYYYY